MVGLIDYMRCYDILKKIESGVKQVGMIAGQALPTVIAPTNYRQRFRAYMDRYFILVPHNKFVLFNTETGESEEGEAEDREGGRDDAYRNGDRDDEDEDEDDLDDSGIFDSSGSSANVDTESSSNPAFQRKLFSSSSSSSSSSSLSLPSSSLSSPAQQQLLHATPLSSRPNTPKEV